MNIKNNSHVREVIESDLEMLLTGSKEESTLRFYERAGYNSSDKTAFITWL